MDYISRHIGPDQQEQQQMLGALGYDSIDALIAAAVPSVPSGRRALVMRPNAFTVAPGSLGDAIIRAAGLPNVAAEIGRVQGEHGNEAIFGGSYGWASAVMLASCRLKI